MPKVLFSKRLTQRRNVQGFTLIELMVVVAITGILASIAYPSFMSQVRKSRRSDAVVAMSNIQQAQERWRANNATYASSITAATTATPPGLGFSSSSSEGGYYTMVISSNTATGYTVTATAVTTKSQNSDTGCTSLVVTVINGSGVKTPTSCWSS